MQTSYVEYRNFPHPVLTRKTPPKCDIFHRSTFCTLRTASRRRRRRCSCSTRVGVAPINVRAESVAPLLSTTSSMALALHAARLIDELVEQSKSRAFSPKPASTVSVSLLLFSLSHSLAVPLSLLLTFTFSLASAYRATQRRRRRAAMHLHDDAMRRLNMLHAFLLAGS